MTSEEKLIQVLEKLDAKLSANESKPGSKESGLLTMDQLAERWEVSRRLVQDLKSSNKIPFVMIGGAVRFPLKDIEQWEARNTNKASGY